MPANQNSPQDRGPQPRKVADLLVRLDLSGGGARSFDPDLSDIRPKEEPLQRWDRLYTQGVAIKEAVNPAYLDATATIFAAVILATGKEKVELLVIGGGDGHFSRKVLPAVLNIVTAHNPAVTVNVLETDLTEKIRQAPGKTAVVNAHKLDQHFAAGSFDVVVGEAMVHQGGQKGIANIIKQVRHVLSKTGTFMHVQDTIPDPTDWVRPERLRQLGMEAAPIMRPKANVSQAAYFAMLEDAHGGLANAVHRETKLLRGAFILMGAEGSAFVDAASIPDWMKTTNANSIGYMHGAVHRRRKDEVPDGKIEVVYRGLITLSRPHQELRTLIDAIELTSGSEAPPIPSPDQQGEVS